jgi:hypothetical protein
MPTPNAIVLGLHFSRVQGVPFLAEEGIKIVGVGVPLQLRPAAIRTLAGAPNMVIIFGRRELRWTLPPGFAY